MTIASSRYTVALTIVAGLVAGGCSDGSGGLGAPAPTVSCAAAVPAALQMCIGEVNATAGACYVDGNAACDDQDADITSALDILQGDIENACVDGEWMSLSVDAMVGRFQNACQSQADSISWRTFGGPQGAVWPDAGSEGQDCLAAAHTAVSQFVDDSLELINDCLAEDNCDAALVDSDRQAAASAAVAAIGNACPALDELIAVDPATYVARAADQVDCTVATAHETVAPLSIACGPSNVDTVPVRGEWTQLVLDGEKWGSICGDGTD